MVQLRKRIGKILHWGSVAVGSVASFGLGHAVKAIYSPVVCTTLTQISPGLFSSTCAGSQALANVFTQAGTNATISTLECVPYLYIDTALTAACFTPLSGVIALSGAGLIVAFLLKRKAVNVQSL